MTKRKLKLEMEDNSANGEYVQRHLPPETLQQRFTCCCYIVYNTSPSLYNSRLLLYTGDAQTTTRGPVPAP
jgi:hypothetical protein